VQSFVANGGRFAIERPAVSWQPATTASIQPAALLLQGVPKIRSPWAFRVTVEADDMDLAYAEAETQLPALLAGLDSLSDGLPFRAMLTSVTNNAAPREVKTTSNVALQIDYEPRDLTAEQARCATDLMKAVARDHKASAAVRLMLDAISLVDAGVGAVPIQAAGLLQFFRAIELVVQDFSAPEADVREREKWESEWSSRLASAEGSELAETVRGAWHGLRTLESVTLAARIDRAGRVWGLADDTIEAAQDFRVFRDTKLAHPTTAAPSADEVREWLKDTLPRAAGDSAPRAYLISLAFVRGYIATL
jgi:hypothetical protein